MTDWQLPLDVSASNTSCSCLERRYRWDVRFSFVSYFLSIWTFYKLTVNFVEDGISGSSKDTMRSF